MTAKEHYDAIRRMTPEERETVERRMLIDMAKRYGVLIDRERQRKAAAIAAAKEKAKEGTA